MSCKQKQRTRFLLFVATGYVYTALVCCLVQSVEDFTASIGWKRLHPDQDEQWDRRHLVKPFFGGFNQRKSGQPGLRALRLQTTSTPERTEQLPGEAKLTQTFSWIVGDVRKNPRNTEDGYQADFGGLHGIQGKVFGLFESTPLFREWQAMRPSVECNDNVMIFTASGEGITHLLVDRAGASPIALFQLPAYCGYSVKTSWRDLEMTVPFDACYINQENGSYVLPLLWWGIPLKLSCPVPMPTPSTSHAVSLSNPAVFCSPYGMAIQLEGEEEDVLVLGVLVNEAWSPLVSEHCAYRVASPSPKLTFFIPYHAPCITHEDNLQLQLVLDDQDYLLSCPFSPQIPLSPSSTSSTSFPGEPQIQNLPNPTGTTSPSPQILEQTVQLPYPHYPNPGHDFPQLPPGVSSGLRYPSTHLTPDPTPEIKKNQEEMDFLYPKESREHLHYPNHLSALVQTTLAPSFGVVHPHSWHPIIPDGPSQSVFDQYHQYMSLFYPVSTPAPTTTIPTTVSSATQPPKHPASLFYHPYYLNLPYYPETTPAPVAQTPAPLPPTPLSRSFLPLKQPSSQHYHHSLSHPQVSLSSLYSYWAESQQKPLSSHSGFVPTQSPTTTNAATFSYPFYFPHDPTKEKPHSPVYHKCLPYIQTVCGYYHNPYYFYGSYTPRYPQVPQYSDYYSPIVTQISTTSTTSTTPLPLSYYLPASHFHHIQCLNGRMVAFLPFAHPDSIQVKDHVQGWLFLSTVSPLCGYMVKEAEGAGVFFYSPLPGCHSQSQAPMTISLAVRFWDQSMGQYRTVDLQCNYQSTPVTSVPVFPSVSPTPPSTTKGKKVQTVVPKTEVYCSSHQMIVHLPPGSISGIEVKDIKGNQMKLQEAPKYCGYSASKGKDGNIHLTFQLHSRCHMSVQSKMHIISVIYMTENERKEAKFSCPVFPSESGQDCTLPTEQRLPCGSGSVSPPQCLSMGCCFNKHPPACYYPMDECTVDRHFVFSVPASLTEPPLTPALLVAASNSSCKPEKVTAEYALFKVPMDGCGTHRVVVGKTVVYMLEVINKVQTISLNYGTITRDSPVRLLLECRYMPGTVLTVSYVVKTPSLGPEIHTQGVFGVQLRIAKDAHYSSYYPQYHQPLQMLLGKPLYLEVRLLNSPDPSLVLLVHFCVAYPRSGKSVWVLLYNGCPNPLDPAASQTVLPQPQPPSPHSQIRRFTISTFQFLPDGEFKDPTEEIYFMCSTEICSPRDGPCVEGCFGQ